MTRNHESCHPEAGLRPKDQHQPVQIEPMAMFCVSPHDSSLRADIIRRPSAQNDKRCLVVLSKKGEVTQLRSIFLRARR